MIYTEAPFYNDRPEFHNSIFLAGSITGSENWQEFARNKLIDHFHIFNPRRKNFDTTNPLAEREQITWEFEYLHQVRYLLFWFSHETLAPITLFEYGAALERYRNWEIEHIFVGIHPEYKRKNDVIIQTELIAPPLSREIVFNLEELCEKTIDFKQNLK